MSDPRFLLKQLHGAVKELRRQQRDWIDHTKRTQSAKASLGTATKRVDEMIEEFERKGWVA